MIHTVSQGPGVALDAQVAALDGGLLINWDVRLDALPESWLRALFDAYAALLRRLAASPDLVSETVERFGLQAAEATAQTKGKPMERPLSALQKAYLLGRGTHLPLSGVAMQEFREYRGNIDPALLRSRLTAMVGRHESLRTRIDERRLVQVVSAEPEINLDIVDLSNLSSAETFDTQPKYSRPGDMAWLRITCADALLFDSLGVRIDAGIVDAGVAAGGSHAAFR